MEHRLHPRVRARIRVVLHRGGHPLASGRIRDIGPDGAFVAVDARRHDLRVGTCIKLEFVLDGRRPRASAVVVHRGDDGVGVMFATLDASARDVVDALTGSGRWPSDERTGADRLPSPDRPRTHGSGTTRA